MRQQFTLTLVGDIWYYYAYDAKGKRHRFSTEQVAKSAANAYCIALARDGALIPGRTDKLTFATFSEPFWVWETCPIVTDKIERGYKYSQTLCKNNRGCMEKNIVPTFGEYLLTDITADMINRWLLGLRRPTAESRGLANSSANKMLRILREMLDVAKKQGLIASNPAIEVHKLADNYEARGCYTVDEARMILSNREAWKSALAWLGSYVAAMTGMREGEIRALRRSDIQGDHILVRHSFDVTVGIKTTKAAKARHVPIPPELRDELFHWAPIQGFIFSLDGGETPVNPDYMLDNLYARMESLGIAYKRRRLCFHSWRHFFNTRLIASGVQGEITRAVVGHQSEDMTELYLHLRRSDMETVAKVQDELVRVVG